MQSLDAPEGDDQTRSHPQAGAQTRSAAMALFRAATAGAAVAADGALSVAMLEDYSRTRARSFVLSVGLLLAAGVAASFWISPLIVTLWLAPALLLQACLAGLTLSRMPGGRVLPNSVLRIGLVFLEAGCGLAWAGLLALVAAHATSDPSIFLITTALVVTASSTSLASSLPAAVWAAGVPVATATATLLAMRGTSLDLALSAVCLAGGLACIVHARRLRATRLALMDSDRMNHRLTANLDAARLRTARALRAAEEANLTRSRFLATMNHELRTPLNAILGFSEVMKDEVLGPMENRTYRDYAADIHASGSQLLALVSDILELSGFEAGRYELREEPVSLARLAEECAALTRTRAQARALTLSLIVEPDLPALFADARSSRQALVNLLLHAIQSAEAGSSVEILVGWTIGGGQYVSVRHSGDTAAADPLHSPITRFEAGDDGLGHTEQGGGVGLAIAAEIAGLHGGAFELRTMPGQPTVATLCYPRSRVMEPRSVHTPPSDVRMVSPILAEPAPTGGEVVSLRPTG